MTHRHRFTPKYDVALGADEPAVLRSLIDLVIQYSTVIQSRRHMTTVGAAARTHWHLQRLRISRVHSRGRMTIRTSEIGVRLMSKGARRHTLAPRSQRDMVGDAHALHELGIEITCNLSGQIRELMANVTVGRVGRDAGFSVVTGEATSVTVWTRLESSFFQPERIT